MKYSFWFVSGFPAPAAYAAYTGRGYSSYPGFGLPGGIAGYPAGKPDFNMLFLVTTHFVHESSLNKKY